MTRIPIRDVYHRRALMRALEEREQEALKNPEKGWVHAVTLAWQRHTQVKALRMLDRYRFRPSRGVVPTSLTLLRADRRRHVVHA